MIQLATDPNASRQGWRPVAAEGKEAFARQGRTGHPWPFIARQAERPLAPQAAPRKTHTESGS